MNNKKMEENKDNNNILESNEATEVFEFKYNFINTPWDDRSKRSKIGIVTLLVSIFVVTMALVVNNFMMHYRDYGVVKNINAAEMSCQRTKVEERPYVARIHSVALKTNLCIGAVVSKSSILANGVCVKSGPVRVILGNRSLPYCKKGFSVDVIETVYHDGIISKKLALLSSYEDITKCSSPISIGKVINWNENAHIVGRPINLGRSLSLQHVTLAGKADMPKGLTIKDLRIESMICTKDVTRCLIRAGDLLIQNGLLYGIAATSVHRTTGYIVACFADLNIVINELKEFDDEITSTDKAQTPVAISNDDKANFL